MHCSYDDIRSRIKEDPKWWDERAVPRYCDFSPYEVANIYCNEVALVEIACQNCGTHFLVAFTSDAHIYAYKKYREMKMEGYSDKQIEEEKFSQSPLADSIRGPGVHYGDPPNVDCCPAGPTMNCDDIRVCEYWFKNKDYNWERDHSLEIQLDSIY